MKRYSSTPKKTISINIYTNRIKEDKLICNAMSVFNEIKIQNIRKGFVSKVLDINVDELKKCLDIIKEREGELIEDLFFTLSNEGIEVIKRDKTIFFKNPYKYLIKVNSFETLSIVDNIDEMINKIKKSNGSEQIDKDELLFLLNQSKMNFHKLLNN